MRTELPPVLLASERGQRADEILRSCVHCGFCNATCPTYAQLGDELDGPRGRIYLIKELLEAPSEQQSAVADRTSTHLDRCLTCRACETTCPSGVAYGELLEIGRREVSQVHKRGLLARWQRGLLIRHMSSARRVRWLARLGRTFAFMLPATLRRNVPPAPNAVTAAPLSVLEDSALHGKRVLLLDGCVQQAATPATNESLARILERRGVEVVRQSQESCCGALALHLGEEAAALTSARGVLQQFAPLASQLDAVVSTASGCGVTQKDYARLFAAANAAPEEQQLAAQFVSKLCDAAELLSAATTLEATSPGLQLAWQAPCSLQHGQQLNDLVEPLLTAAGYSLVPVADPHLCCGSAGTYSVLQPQLSQQLAADKVGKLMAAQPERIATANVGCQLHLDAAAPVPVQHWLELLQ
ncbi:MAG: glycolate oxidase subunit GlcF [Pseudomonadales bacterium]